MASFISGMGLDFRDFNNDGYPDIAFVALNNQTFPLFQNTGKGDFKEVTTPSGMRELSLAYRGFRAGLYDFDNDGWKDLFVTGDTCDRCQSPGSRATTNMVFAIPALTASGGTDRRSRASCGATARHRGCAFGDLDGDGRVDVVVTALGTNCRNLDEPQSRDPATGWTLRSRDQEQPRRHWRAVKVVSKRGRSTTT